VPERKVDRFSKVKEGDPLAGDVGAGEKARQSRRGKYGEGLK